MNTLLKVVLILLVSCGFSTPCFALENAFYILRINSPVSNELSSLKNHYKSIDVLISQAYRINEHGVVKGFVDPSLLNFANEHSIKIMAMVTNVEFDQNKIHRFLSNPAAQKQAIKTILEIIKQHHYYGVQFDFESIALKDREALTRFYLAAANALHNNGFVVSFAVIPVVNDGPQESVFLERKYENWGGAYDLQALGKSGDFITLMAYDQHTSGTPPGPIAGIRWVDAVVKHTLRFIPSQKISLGIPVYSGYWFTGLHSVDGGERLSAHLTNLTYEQVRSLLSKYNVKLKWDANDQVNYGIYQNAWLNEYVFVEDVESFRAKLALAKKYHLGGISVFTLGDEDPRIWSLLKSRRY